MSVDADDKWKRKFMVCRSSAGQTSATMTTKAQKRDSVCGEVDISDRYAEMSTNQNGFWTMAKVGGAGVLLITFERDQTNGTKN